jgi:hypothetical protein
MNAAQASRFDALVWCPASNYFLLNKTAPVKELKSKTAVVFGTDSTLTAGWSIWDHLRLARKQNSLTDEELFNAITKTAAAVWQLDDKGLIKENAAADIVVAKTTGSTMDSFYAITPEDILLILRSGDICLFDESLLTGLQQQQYNTDSFSKIIINGIIKYVHGDLPGLVKKIKAFYPEVILPVLVN